MERWITATVHKKWKEKKDIHWSSQLTSPFVFRTVVTKFLLEHDGELFESLFGHASSIAGLDLLFQIVFHAHGQLIQLIPLLGKIHCAVLRVPISTTRQMLITQVYT